MNVSDSHQQEQQTYYAWIRDHFLIDSNDLEEISSCIAVPGLTDIAMPDVLSLLADEDDWGPTKAAGNQQQQQLQKQPESLAAVAGDPHSHNTPLQLAGEQLDQMQGQQRASFVVSSFQQPTTFLQPAELQAGGGQQQIWQQQQAQQLNVQEQLLPHIPCQDWLEQQDQGLSLLYAPAASQAAAAGGHVPLSQSAPHASDQAEQDSMYQAGQAAVTASTAALVTTAWPRPPTPVSLALGDLPVLTSTSADFLQETAVGEMAAGTATQRVVPEACVLQSQLANVAAKAVKPPSPVAGCIGACSSQPSSGGAGTEAGAATAAASAAVEGVVKRRTRKPSQAQREAHKRFRQRKKDMVASLENEVAAKQAQLQALSLEHTALAAKARALDQLVASAGESFDLVQQLSALQLQTDVMEQQQQTQQQQQQPRQQQHVPLDTPVLPAAPAAAPPALADRACPIASSHSTQKQQHQADSHKHQQLLPQDASCHSQSPAAASGPAEGALQQLQFGQLEDMQQLLQLGGLAEEQQLLLQLVGRPARISVQAQQAHERGGRLMSSSNSSSLASGASGGSGGGVEGSLEHLEAAVTRLLAVPYDPVQLMPVTERERMQAALAKMQAFIKSLVAEVMQLVLQIGAERSSNTSTWPATHPLQQQQYEVGLLVQQQQQQQNGLDASAIAAAASPASLRLQFLLSQVRKEFRTFSVSNRISLYYLQTLNHETGQLGVALPSSHWAKVAHIVRDRLPPEVLADMMVARQLYSSAVTRIKQQRHALVLQLQQVLGQYSSVRQYTSHVVLSNVQGLHDLLDAIDSSLRKEYTLEGVHQWAFHKLIPHTLAAELLVHSWPYLPDMHAILQQLQPGHPELQLKQLMPAA